MTMITLLRVCIITNIKYFFTDFMNFLDVKVICDVEQDDTISLNGDIDLNNESFSIEIENKSVETLTKVVHDLQERLKAVSRQCRHYKSKLEKRDHNIARIFNEDQYEFLKRDQFRGMQWSEETITKALKLYLACGTQGYEEIRRQHLPYPSIRTLQHRLRNLKFRPGILEDVFKIMEMKVSGFLVSL